LFVVVVVVDDDDDEEEEEDDIYIHTNKYIWSFNVQI
jgi:hypothetical protein